MRLINIRGLILLLLIYDAAIGLLNEVNCLHNTADQLRPVKYY